MGYIYRNDVIYGGGGSADESIGSTIDELNGKVEEINTSLLEHLASETGIIISSTKSKPRTSLSCSLLSTETLKKPFKDVLVAQNYR